MHDDKEHLTLFIRKTPPATVMHFLEMSVVVGPHPKKRAAVIKATTTRPSHYLKQRRRRRQRQRRVPKTAKATKLPVALVVLAALRVVVC